MRVQSLARRYFKYSDLADFVPDFDGRIEGSWFVVVVAHHSTSLMAFVTFVCDVNLYNNCGRCCGHSNNNNHFENKIQNHRVYPLRWYQWLIRAQRMASVVWGLVKEDFPSKRDYMLVSEFICACYVFAVFILLTVASLDR